MKMHGGGGVIRAVFFPYGFVWQGRVHELLPFLHRLSREEATVTAVLRLHLN
ncbi:MAG TPA: hypothetical protein GX511_06995 [Firmicutes bacterium]|nr:hypothetical protein [Bacillota bacterium]